MKYSDAKKLFDVMSDEMTRLGGLCSTDLKRME